MECISAQELVNKSECVVENTAEQVLEMEVSLAEYHGEIMQILKCIPDIKIMSKQVTSNKIIIDGYVNFKIIYISKENKNINCYEQNMSFNKSIDLNNEYKDHIVDVDYKIDYLNCRAINERRIDLRGSIIFNTKTYYTKNLAISVNMDCNTIQQRLESIAYNPTISLKEKLFTMNEIINLNVEDVDDIVILRCDNKMNLFDYKCIKNKVIVKGECIINLAYLENKYDEEIKYHTQIININQIVDVDGVYESCECIISSKLLSCVFDKTEKTEDKDSEILINLYSSIIVKAYEERTISYINDIYSTKYEIDFNKEKTVLEQITSKKDVKLSKTVVIDDFVLQGSEIIDFYIDIVSKETTVNQDNLIFNVTYEFNCFYKNNENEILFSSKTKIISYEFDKEEFLDIENSYINIVKFEFKYTQRDTSVEINIDLTSNFNISKKIDIEFINKVDIDNDKEKDNIQNNTLTIYYGDKGELIWDIAKKYNTCVNEILKQNNLESEYLKERTMLLIPIVR